MLEMNIADVIGMFPGMTGLLYVSKRGWLQLKTECDSGQIVNSSKGKKFLIRRMGMELQI